MRGNHAINVVLALAGVAALLVIAVLALPSLVLGRHAFGRPVYVEFKNIEELRGSGEEGIDAWRIPEVLDGRFRSAHDIFYSDDRQRDPTLIIGFSLSADEYAKFKDRCRDGPGTFVPANIQRDAWWRSRWSAYSDMDVWSPESSIWGGRMHFFDNKNSRVFYVDSPG